MDRKTLVDVRFFMAKTNDVILQMFFVGIQPELHDSGKREVIVCGYAAG